MTWEQPTLELVADIMGSTLCKRDVLYSCLLISRFSELKLSSDLHCPLKPCIGFYILSNSCFHDVIRKQTCICSLTTNTGPNFNRHFQVPQTLFFRTVNEVESSAYNSLHNSSKTWPNSHPAGVVHKTILAHTHEYWALHCSHTFVSQLQSRGFSKNLGLFSVLIFLSFCIPAGTICAGLAYVRGYLKTSQD